MLGFVWESILLITSVILLVIIILRPNIGLTLSFLVQSLYIFYPLHYGWEGGKIRVAITTVFMVFLYTALALRLFTTGHVKRWKTPIDKLILLFACFPVSGFFIGVLRGYDIYSILQDLYPFVEFMGVFLLSTLIIRSEYQIRRILRWVLSAFLFTELIEVVLYFIQPTFYFHQVEAAGLAVPRIADFTQPIILSLIAGMLIYTEQKKSKLLIVIPLLASTLSFLKSIWVAEAVTFVFIFFLIDQTRKRNLLRNLAFGVIVLGIVIAPSSLLRDAFVSRNFISISRGMLQNLFNSEWISYTDRLGELHWLLNEIGESPVWGKGLGAGKWTALAETRLAAQRSPIKWKTDVFSYPLAIAFKMGLPALFMAIFVGFVVLRYGISTFNKLEDGYPKGLVLGILASFLCIGIITTTAFTPFTHFPIAAYLGFGTALIFIVRGIYLQPTEIF